MTEFITNFFANPWVSLGGKVLLVALIVPLTAMVLGFAELKLSAKMQFRVGSSHSGPASSSRISRWGSSMHWQSHPSARSVC
jgi:NADH:ubiquinone oxidoreductase subunit H